MRLDSSTAGLSPGSRTKKPWRTGGQLVAESFQCPKRSWVTWFILDRSQKVEKACEDSGERIWP